MRTILTDTDRQTAKIDRHRKGQTHGYRRNLADFPNKNDIFTITFFAYSQTGWYCQCILSVSIISPPTGYR